MIIDAVVARDEDDLLDFRVKYLEGLVDLHIVGESAISFGGTPKPLHFSERKARGTLPEKVTVLEIKIPDTIIESGSSITVQDYVRKEFASMIWEQFPQSTVFFVDVDEIPSRSQVESAKTLPNHDLVAVVPMRMFSRKANWELLLRKKGWFNPKLFKGKPSMKNIRSHFTPLRVAGEFGAHLSFLNMGETQLRRKFSDYGHQEYNKNGLWNKGLLAFCDRYGLDHLGQASRNGRGLLGFVSDQELPSVAQEAVALHPEWRGESFSGGLLGRLFRAKLVEHHVRHKDSVGREPQTWPPAKRSYIWAAASLLLDTIQHGLLQIVTKPRRKKDSHAIGH